MDDFPANSSKAKTKAAPAPKPQQREKLEPVTSAKTAGRKRGLGRHFKETFFNGSGKEAFGYMVEDIVLPSVKDMILDALHGGLDRLFNGDRAAKPRGTPSWMSGGAGHVNYGGYSNPTKAAQETQPRTLSRRARAQHSFDDIIIPTRQDAEEVLDQLFEQLSRYGGVTVAELYTLTDIQPSHTDMKWGWTSLRGAKAVKLRTGGFLLDLPEPEALG
jgi:hypothetical protein